MKAKVPLTRKQLAPRNIAAKVLREGQYKPKVEDNPNAYKRRPKHPPKLPESDDNDET